MKNLLYILTALLLLLTPASLGGELEANSGTDQTSASTHDKPIPTPTFNKEFARNVIDYKDPNELMQAIIDNKPLSEIQRIIDSGIDINALDSNGNHVLHYVECISPQNKELEKLLYNNGISKLTIYNSSNISAYNIYISNDLQRVLKNEIPFEPSMTSIITNSNNSGKLNPKNTPVYPPSIGLIWGILHFIGVIKFYSYTYINAYNLLNTYTLKYFCKFHSISTLFLSIALTLCNLQLSHPIIFFFTKIPFFFLGSIILTGFFYAVIDRIYTWYIRPLWPTLDEQQNDNIDNYDIVNKTDEQKN